VVGHLERVPAAADPELEASSRERVEARHLLGELDRIALHHQADAGTDPQLTRGLGRHRERHEGIHHVVVLHREAALVSSRRERRDREVGMLGHPERLEAVLLGGDSELCGMNRVVGRKDGEAVLHGWNLVLCSAERRGW